MDIELLAHDLTHQLTLQCPMNKPGAHVTRNERANHKCRTALETRNSEIHSNLLQKRDIYDNTIENGTEYTPQGLNTYMCTLSEENVLGSYVLSPKTLVNVVCAGGYE